MFKIEIVKTGPRRLAGLQHFGAYTRIGETMARLAPLLGSKTAGSNAVAVYFDNPMVTAEADLKSFAGVGIGWKKPIPEGLGDLRLSGGRCAVLHHTGPYETLPAAWSELTNWVHLAGETFAAQPPYEVYRSMEPGNLQTDIYWQIA